MAGLARRRGHEALDLLARPFAFGLAVAPLEVLDHALERLLHLVGAHAVVVGEADLLVARAVEDDLARLLRQARPRRVEAELVVAAERLERLQIVGRARLRPRRDRALAQGQARVGNDQAGVDGQLRAEAAAGRAGAVGVVEREQPRLDLGDGEAGDRAGEFRREQDAPRLAAVGRRDRRIRRSPSRPPARARSRSFRRGGSPCRGAPPGGRPPPRCRASASCRAPARRRSRRTVPSIFSRWKPRFMQSAISLRYSPLRPRTTGAVR